MLSNGKTKELDVYCNYCSLIINRNVKDDVNIDEEFDINVSDCITLLDKERVYSNFKDYSFPNFDYNKNKSIKIDESNGLLEKKTKNKISLEDINDAKNFQFKIANELKGK